MKIENDIHYYEPNEIFKVNPKPHPDNLVFKPVELTTKDIDINRMIDEIVRDTDPEKVELFFRKYFMIKPDEYFEFSYVPEYGLIQFNAYTGQVENTNVEINVGVWTSFKEALETIIEIMKEQKMTTITGR